MSTVEEIEYACSSERPSRPTRHAVEPPDLELEKTLYPYGFPAAIRTNSEQILAQLTEIWGKFERQHNTAPIQIDAQLVESASRECPPEPTYRLMMPLMMCVADRDNYGVADLDRCCARMTVSTAALRHRLYAQYFLLGMPVSCVATHFATPIHAACVSLHGRGILLCGDSGAGKSTLSYACARGGWTYVSDDASFLLNGGTERLVTGNCHQVRFRPSAGELFPEIKGLEITPRAAGKPSIEMPTAAMPHMVCTQTTRVDQIVFLNRRSGDSQQLVPYRRDVARQFMRQVLFGSAVSLVVQYEAIERLLTAEFFELRYHQLDWAVERLRALVESDR
jgi:hypothetical protein